MRYVISDVHGEYELFVKLLEEIGFSPSDELFICGDIIDKGHSSVRLLRLIASMRENVHAILGNHELEFLKYYRALAEECSGNFDELLQRLSAYFPEDGHLLDWETVDYLDALPAYIEQEDFICVHAGVPLDIDGRISPLRNAPEELLVNDRKFKDPALIHRDPRCVFFGHTQTDAIAKEARILGYRRRRDGAVRSLSDIYKVHLDCGSWSNGILACFCIDTLEAIYIKK